MKGTNIGITWIPSICSFAASYPFLTNGARGFIIGSGKPMKTNSLILMSSRASIHCTTSWHFSWHNVIKFNKNYDDGENITRKHKLSKTIKTNAKMVTQAQKYDQNMTFEVSALTIDGIRHFNDVDVIRMRRFN